MVIIFFAIGYAYIVLKVGLYEAQNDYLRFLCFGFIIQLIPLIAIHNNYYKQNKNDTIICDYDNKNIVFQHGNDRPIEIKQYQIEKVTRYLSPLMMKKNRGGILIWDRYNYCQIKLIDGESIIITSLLVRDINGFLNQMGIDIDKIEMCVGIYNNINAKAIYNNIK